MDITMQKETELVNKAYWDELVKTATDPEVQGFAEDMSALEDSIEDARSYAYSEDALAKEAEERAEQIIAGAEALLDADSDVLNAFQDVITNEDRVKALTSEQAKELSDMLAESAREIKYLHPDEEAAKLRQALELEAKRAVAEHPMRFLISQMKDTMAELRDARECCKQSEAGYKGALQRGAKAVATTVGNMYMPVKASVLDSIRDASITLGGIANTAYDKFAEIAKNAREALNKGSKALSKCCDVFLEATTLGRWSRFCKKIEKKACDYVARKEGFETKVDYSTRESERFHFLLEREADKLAPKTYMERKEDEFYDKVDRAAEFLAFNLVKNKVSFVIKGNSIETDESRVEYWKSIKDALWTDGISMEDRIEKAQTNMHNKMKAYESARNEKVDAFEQKIAEAPGKIYAAAYLKADEIEETVNKAGKMCEDIATRASGELEVLGAKIKAQGLGMAAAVAEKTATFYERSERRISAKIAKLEAVDNAIFDSMQKIKKEMHALTEITPFVREPYVPDKQITEQIENLKALTPTSAIKFQIKLYEKALAKKEAAHEKAYDKLEAIHEKKLEKAQSQASSLSADYLELQGKQTENGAKLEEALEKLNNLAEKREALQDYAADKTAGAMSMVKEAIDRNKASEPEMEMA